MIQQQAGLIICLSTCHFTIFNASPHSALGYKTPFEVYYCRKPLGLTKPLLEDIKEMNSTSNSPSNSPSNTSFASVNTQSHCTAEQTIRLEAKNSSDKAVATIGIHTYDFKYSNLKTITTLHTWLSDCITSFCT